MEAQGILFLVVEGANGQVLVEEGATQTIGAVEEGANKLTQQQRFGPVVPAVWRLSQASSQS